MNNIEITASSLSAFKASMRVSSNSVQSAAKGALSQATEEIFKIAQSRVPVVTGSLRNSGRISSNQNGSYIQHIISYGDETVNIKTSRATALYALKVHETFNRRNPEGYKWLEKSVQQNADLFCQIMANRLRSAL